MIEFQVILGAHLYNRMKLKSSCITVEMRIICSPYIIEEDQIALNEGYAARGVKDVEAALIDEINNMLNDAYLSKPSRILACLVAMGVIDLKVAIIKPEATPEVKRLFHDKVGIFKDSLGNELVSRFNGETFKGLSADDIESIDVFQIGLIARQTA